MREEKGRDIASHNDCFVCSTDEVDSGDNGFLDPSSMSGVTSSFGSGGGESDSSLSRTFNFA